MQGANVKKIKLCFMVSLLIIQSKDSAWINVRQTKFETAATIKIKFTTD